MGLRDVERKNQADGARGVDAAHLEQLGHCYRGFLICAMPCYLRQCSFLLLCDVYKVHNAETTLH